MTIDQANKIIDLLGELYGVIGTSGGGSSTLAGLSDVLLANLEVNNSLHYNGTDWVNNYLGNRYILNQNYTIPDNSQLVIKEELIINGTELIVEGDLYIDTQ